MSSKLGTFQRILLRCEAGERAAWEVFLTRYTPIVYALIEFYLPMHAGEGRGAFWAQGLRALGANGHERLKGFDHQAEREFLADLRAFLFARAGQATDISPRWTSSGPQPTFDSLAAQLDALPLAQKEVVFFKLAGYSDATLEEMLLLPSSAIRRSVQRLDGDYGEMMRRQKDGCPWPAAWLEVLTRARAAGQDDCPSRRVFVRLLDGQTTWYEKVPAEEHMAHCLHCLESWVALREVTYLRRVTRSLPPSEVKGLLASVPLVASRSSLIARLFKT
ncbi:MAG: hypothetical protein LAN62_15620 [Acidobacteriia bacterium]|nr:hypothetical protein [Terriglobia bacterium]